MKGFFFLNSSPDQQQTPTCVSFQFFEFFFGDLVEFGYLAKGGRALFLILSGCLGLVQLCLVLILTEREETNGVGKAEKDG